MERVLSCCKAYPQGVTEAILLSELFKSWSEKERLEGSGKNKRARKSLHVQGKKKRQSSLPNIATIDSILEKNFVALDAVMDVVVADVRLLPGTSIYLLTLEDFSSKNTIEHYLHRKFYDMVQGEGCVIRNGRELRMTGCRLRAAVGLCELRLLPTEYLVVILDEEDNDDALLLGAQFCSDTFTSIEHMSTGVPMDYYLHTKLEKTVDVEMRGNKKHLKQRQLLLSDSNGDRLPLILWDDQVSVANLFSEGSMVAVEKPFVTRDYFCDTKTASGICLEFGTCTRLFSVPYIQLEEQVTVGATQVMELLPCSVQGSVDFIRYPLRIIIEDLRPKMSNIALYGCVTSAGRLESCKELFVLGIEDHSGHVKVELRFVNAWTAGELHLGQTVFMSGLSVTEEVDGRLKCSWIESHGCLVNVTRLTAIICSPCLHSIVPVLSPKGCGRVSRVKVGKVDAQLERVHAVCGQHVIDQMGSWYCRFCEETCEQTAHSFHAVLSLFDVVEGRGEAISALAVGEAAFSVLQVSADSFCTWPEDEQVMYLFSLEGEEFLVSFYQEDPLGTLKIGCAIRWEC